MLLKTVAILFFASLALFLVLFLLVLTETKKGHRIFAVRIRNRLDKIAFLMTTFSAGLWSKTVLLYSRYMLHFLFLKIMSIVVAVYEYLEKLFYNNRKEVKRLRLLKKKK